MKINKELLKKIGKNTYLFILCISFIILFQTIFGPENVLLAVSLSVGLTTFPICDYNIKPFTMFFIIVFLFISSTIIPQFALGSPWLSFPINLLFVALIIALSHEPEMMKPSISFLINFVFLQATPVPWSHFKTRLLCAIVGSLLIGVVTLIFWKKRNYGIGEHSRNLKQQIELCMINRDYIVRMSLGIAIAMFIGMILHLKKPLWISIVVMSLTQLEFSETLERIKHRFIGTLVGVIIFFIVFQLLIPQQYTYLFIFLIGYIGYYMPEYKYKQVINAVSALNASLVLLDSPVAIYNRILCLIGGIIIVVSLYLFAFLYKKWQRKHRHIQSNKTLQA